jgi:hypothetical protein
MGYLQGRGHLVTEKRSIGVPAEQGATRSLTPCSRTGGGIPTDLRCCTTQASTPPGSGMSSRGPTST